MYTRKVKYETISIALEIQLIQKDKISLKQSHFLTIIGISYKKETRITRGKFNIFYRIVTLSNYNSVCIFLYRQNKFKNSAKKFIINHHNPRNNKSLHLFSLKTYWSISPDFFCSLGHLFYTSPSSLLRCFLVIPSIFLPYPIHIPPLYMIWDKGGTTMGQPK